MGPDPPSPPPPPGPPPPPDDTDELARIAAQQRSLENKRRGRSSLRIDPPGEVSNQGGLRIPRG